MAAHTVSSLRTSGMRHSFVTHRSGAVPQGTVGGRKVVAVAALPTADQDGAGPALRSSTIFYGGKSYTEGEWRDAVASGSLVAPLPASVSSRSTSAITFNVHVMRTPATIAPAHCATIPADAMAFAGPVPEKANGRLAMLGFTSAVAAELASGEPVSRQLTDEPTGIIAVFVLFMAASLVPAFAGRKEDAVGPFTPQAEMINGRAAMIGFAAMLAIEAVKGGALF